MEKLTEEQSEMVEKNHSLIYWYCHRSNLSVNEWYGILAIELCYAVINYKPERGSLSGYFKLRADCVVYRECKKNQAVRNIQVETEHIDWMAIPAIVEDPIDKAQLNETFSGEYGEVIRLRYEGYTQSQIAEILGTSQSMVSKMLKKIRGVCHLDG